MKVIKPGKSPSWEEMKTCTGHGNGGYGCGAELSVSLDDLFMTYRSDYTGEVYGTYVTFRCPCCEKYTDLPESIARDLSRNFSIPDDPTG